MPDRLIREGFKHSPRINQLDDRAECAFLRLLTTVDDGGVYYAAPLQVRAAIWPTKSYRLAEVARVLDLLERAGLIARWTAGDGVRYLCLLRFRQRLAYGIRRRYPKPPFDEDTGDMRLELAVDDPPPAPPKKRREEKRREGTRESAPAPAISQEDWMAELRERFPALDVDAELQRALANRKKLGKPLERGWFETSWLANCSQYVETPKARPQPAPSDEPPGWRIMLQDTQYGPGGAFEADTWGALPSDVRKVVTAQLQETT